LSITAFVDAAENLIEARNSGISFLPDHRTQGSAGPHSIIGVQAGECRRHGAPIVLPMRAVQVDVVVAKIDVDAERVEHAGLRRHPALGGAPRAGPGAERVTADRASLWLSVTAINNCINYFRICNLQRISRESAAIRT
jgi:hypothetical protein